MAATVLRDHDLVVASTSGDRGSVLSLGASSDAG
jgi:hypothetical protein